MLKLPLINRLVKELKGKLSFVVTIVFSANIGIGHALNGEVYLAMMWLYSLTLLGWIESAERTQAKAFKVAAAAMLHAEAVAAAAMRHAKVVEKNGEGFKLKS